MRDTKMRGSRSRRSLFSGSAAGAAAALVLSGVIITPAHAAEGETVTGTSYSNATGYMSVTPGTELNPDGTTTVTVEGFEYDETKPVYVGLGKNLVPETPEQWRRSEGGFSGPTGDYDYGVPRLVVAHGSSDGDVADAEMDADGHWSMSVNVPGSTVTSFFGGEIDCLTGGGCGFFSFGAHGQIAAVNEAYVGIEFAEPSQAVAPEITGQPQDAIIEEGADATFSVTASGDPALNYQWQRAAASSDEFADIDGATDASYTLTGAQAADDGAKFRAVVSNEAGEATSNAASLTVTEGEDPEPGSNSATGLGYNYDPEKQEQPSLTVTWPEGGLPADEPSTATLSGKNYAISSDFGTNFGGAYTLFGAVVLKDDSDPGSWAPTKRGVAGVNYDYAGEAGVYQQMVNYPGNDTEPGLPYMDANGDWVFEDHPVPGATFTSQANKEINCLAEDTQCGFITIGAHGQRSAGVEVFTPVEFAGEEPPAGEAPEITAQPQSVNVDEGDDAEFSVTATGDPAPSYQWQVAEAGSDEWNDIEDATAASYTVTGALAADSGKRFRVIVTNAEGEATSAEATLTVEVTAATETTTAVAQQAIGSYPTDFAGQAVELSASVSPENAAGSVEFFSDGQRLGSAPAEGGAAQLTASDLTGGSHKITAKFTPSDAGDFAPSESAAVTYRVVDLEPAVGTIDVGDAAKQISGAELRWGVANFVSFGSGPGKEVLDGNVELSELPENPTANDHANREFVFSNGTGTEDAAGNRVISFDGEVRLISGSMPEWNFRQPEVFVNAAGDGYITAIVDGAFKGSLLGGEDETYGPERVVVQTFTGADPEATDDGTAFTVTPLFEGQVAAGTWSGDFTGATLTNQFLQHVNAGVRSFFLQSGSSSDSTKAARPLTVSYTAGTLPQVSVSDDLTVIEGDEAVFTATASGDPEPTLQWQKLVGDDWQDIEGQTGAELALTEVTADDAGQYRVVAENSFGTVESDKVTLAVTALEAAAIVNGPKDQSVTEGDDATFEVEAVGVPEPTYQWQQLAAPADEAPADDAAAAQAFGEAGTTQDDDAWTDIEDATSASFTVAAVQLDQDGDQFRVVVSNGVGDPAMSDAVSLQVSERTDSGGDSDGESDGGSNGSGNSGTNVAGETSAKSGLASTGSMLPLAATGAGALLLLAGTVLVLRRRSGISAD